MMMQCICCGALVPQAQFCCQCGAPQKQTTLGELYASWSAMHYRRLSKKGQDDYRLSWNVLRILENRPVVSLNLEDYQGVMDSIADSSYSRQQKLRLLIGCLCKYAQVRRIATPNYATHLILDGYRSKGRLIFSDEEIKRLFFYSQSAQGPYWEDAQIVMVLMLTGLRPEELFNVKKSDVDMTARCIHTVGSKTEAGRNRTVPIAQPIKQMILYMMLRHPQSPYLITSPTGCRCNLSNWRKRKFFPLMWEMGINPPDDPHRLVPYCCRHTYASLAKRAGVDAGVLCKMIGHADPKITEDYYIHETLEEMQREVDKVTRLTASITGVQPLTA